MLCSEEDGLKYTIPGISILISFILWTGQKWVSQVFGQKIEKIIAKIRWGWILICSLSVFLGFVYADFYNENSQLREWIREQNKIANVERFVLASKVNNKESWYEAVIHLRFLSKLDNVRCTIEVTQYVGIDHAQNSFIIKQEVIPNVDKNLILKLIVSTFPTRISKELPVGYPFWGENKNHTWAGDGRHIVKLNLSSGFKHQSQKFLISAIKNVGAGPEPVILFGGPESQSYLQIR